MAGHRREDLSDRQTKCLLQVPRSSIFSLRLQLLQSVPIGSFGGHKRTRPSRPGPLLPIFACCSRQIPLNSEHYSCATSRGHSPAGNPPDNRRARREERAGDDIPHGFQRSVGGGCRSPSGPLPLHHENPAVALHETPAGEHPSHRDPGPHPLRAILQGRRLLLPWPE